MDNVKIYNSFFGKFIDNVNDSYKKGIPIGDIVGIDNDVFVRYMDKWCESLDRIIEKDLELNNGLRYNEALQTRGYTYSEFIDLFNDHIAQENYLEYPVFQYLGIDSEVQRRRFTIRYEPNEEDYLKSLKENGKEDLLVFFSDKYVQPKKMFPFKDSDKHTFIFGGTGVGKSTMIDHLIHRIRDDYNYCANIIIDPHGPLARRVYESSLSSGEETIYLDIDLKEGTSYGLNLFDLPDKKDKTLRFASENIIAVFSELLETGSKFSDIQKAMLQKCINYNIRRPDASMNTLLELLRLDEDIIEDAKEYSAYFRDEYVRQEGNKTRIALITRMELFLDNEGLRNVLLGSSTFDIEDSINKGKTVIFNLGGFPDEISRPAFGKLLVVYLKNILSRRDVDVNPDVVPCFVWMDEAPEFITSSVKPFEKMLSQMRKYGARMVLICQYINQLGALVESVQKNTFIKIGTGSSPDDFKGIIKLPNKYIIKSEDDSERVDIGKFEWFVEITYQRVQKAKAPDFKIKSNKYKLTEIAVNELTKYQLDNYYRPTGEKPTRTPKKEKDIDLESFYVPEDLD